MRDHRRLRAFVVADELVLSVYEATRLFPTEELYGLVSQMRRAAVSIPSNIVEGCGRDTNAEYLRFFDIAFGSARELGYQITLAQRLGYLPDLEGNELAELADECNRVLSGLIRSLRQH